MKNIWRLVLALALVPGVAQAQPVGRWWSDFAGGAPEYGFQKDRGGLDAIAIACGPGGTTMRVTIGGAKPRPREMVKFFIGATEWDLFSNDAREITVEDQDASGDFLSLWNGIRGGQTLRVRLASGGTAAFTLKGTSRALPRQPCR